MTNTVVHTVDKSTWPVGPWTNEPDKQQWQDPATGLACMIVRNDDSGNLCGYVGVPPGHSQHGANYNDVEADVHGGLTYGAVCRGSVCHIPEPGQPDDVYWLGFDCAHLGDLSPNMIRRGYTFQGDVYRDFGYDRAECTRLAAQLAEP